MTTPNHLKRVKVASRLFKRGEVYYYRAGDFEEKLGKFKSDKEAIMARDIFERLRTRIGAESFDYRVKHLWPDYAQERRAQLDPLPGRRPLSPRTVYEMEAIWQKHLAKFFANRKLADIDDPLWNEYCRKAKVADLTNHRKVLKTFLTWCKANGKMRVLPEMQIPAVRRRKRKRIPPEHLVLIFQHAPDGGLIFICQYLYMLMRRSEQCRARWEHYSFTDDWVIIPDENTRTRTGRVIPLNPMVKAMLLRWRQRQLEAGLKSPYIFPKRNRPKEHMTESGIGRFWKETIEAAGLSDLGYEPHDLRATGEHEAGKDPRYTDIQREKMAGASITTQKRIYLQGYMADDLRGLESVVQIEGIDRLIDARLAELDLGKTREGGKR